MAGRQQSAIRRSAKLLALSVLGLSLTVAESALSPAGSGEARAQEWGGGLIGRLFGGRPRRSYDDRRDYQPPPRYYIDPPSPRQKARPSAPRPKSAKKADPGTRAGGAAAASAGGAAAAAAAAPAPVEKAPDAKPVLVVGDFMALSLAKGLEASAAQNPALRVVDRTDGSSGLVRDDHLDWPERIPAIIDEEKPAAVVVMLGSNDRQAIRTGEGSEELRSSEWTSAYEARAEALAKAVADKKLPLIWVGLPAFKSSRMSDDVAFFNELYRKAATGVGAEFADVWDGFVDANGAFASTGPDVAGQPARLRNSDGITMTPQGARKLAFFVEKPLEKVLGGNLEGGAVAAAKPEAEKAVPQNPANATAVPVVALASPSLDGGEALIAARPAAGVAGTEASPREKLVDAGTSLPVAAGRADDFAWNAKAGPVQPRPAPEPVVSRGSLDLQSVRTARPAEPPQPMPSLQDAIIEDWNAAEKAEAAKRATASAPPDRSGSAAAPR